MPDPIPAASLLAVHGLCCDWGGPFDLLLRAGECVAVQGASGAGKSLLLRLIADLDPGRGEVLLRGQRREHWSGPAWRRQVIYQAAEPAWWAPTPAPHFPPACTGWLVQAMAQLGLGAGVLAQPLVQLSTGERQRLALLRSLAREPALLLLDEPTAALDATSVRAVEALLQAQLAAGLGIVLVTHSTEQAARIASRCLLLAGGRLQDLA